MKMSIIGFGGPADCSGGTVLVTTAVAAMFDLRTRIFHSCLPSVLMVGDRSIDGPWSSVI